MKQSALQDIIERVGGQKALAQELGVVQQTVSWWVLKGVPAKHVPALVKLDKKYGGRTKPSQLNPLFEIRA